MRGFSAVLTHHWLTRRRGGEKVLEALAELLPDAPLYTLVHNPEYVRRLESSDRPDAPCWLRDPQNLHSSWLQRIPGAARHYPNLLPLMPFAAAAVRLPAADLVLCSDAALAKAMRAHPRSRVICYCHSPMRYAWDLESAYRASVPWLVRPLWALLVRWIRAADRRAAQRVDVFIANSAHVAARIARCYGRESRVIHPPVDLPERPPPRAPAATPYYLCVGHHVPYKRLDLALEACRRLDRRLVVIGDGPDCRRLRDRAGRAEFLGWQPDAVIHGHYAEAAGLLFPGEEDFGMVPVEAMSRGCPVIAYGAGGATETVVDGETGVLFAEQSVEDLCAGMRRAEAQRFDPQRMHAQARRFSRERFLEQMRAVIAETLDAVRPTRVEAKG